MIPLTALEFLSEFTREVLRVEPMDRQHVVAEWASKLEDCYTPFPDPKH